MSNPNIVAVTTILGTTTFLAPANTTANVLLSNASGSNLVFKVNNIVCANVTGSAANVTVSIDNQAAGAGTDFPIVSAVRKSKVFLWKKEKCQKRNSNR